MNEETKAADAAPEPRSKCGEQVWSFRDITEHMLVVEALRESEAKYRRIIEGLTDYQYTVRIENGIAVKTVQNPACERVTGYTQEEFNADPYLWIKMVTPEDCDMVRDRVQKLLEGVEIPPIEHRIIRKDGELRWVSDTTILFKNATGDLLSYDGVVKDITERKRGEEEKDNLMAQLHQSQKMDSIGRLAGGVAHDFNNMLSVIHGYAQLALMETEKSQSIYPYLLEIRKGAERSAELTRQLLAFARKQTITPKVLYLNETVTDILKMLQRLIGENIQLIWEPEANQWPVNMDPSQIDQIMANLCVNARDAITNSGTIIITTKNIFIDAIYCSSHAGLLPGEYVLLTVSDNGCGMSKDTQIHLFEPFFTTKGASEGTGLGLATVYGIVKQNNGFINVCSEPDLGTTFTIYLPRHTGSGEPEEIIDTAQPVMSGTETILLVEDEPSILRITTMTLEKQGYIVLAANTPEEAIKQAKEHAGEIDLLVTDVVMPEMNGQNLVNSLLSTYPQIKILFMSGYTTDIIAHNGVLIEGVHFMQKPLFLPSLEAKVREVLDSSANAESLHNKHSRGG